MNIQELLWCVTQYIQESERQLNGAELRPDMPRDEMPLLYAEALQLLAIVERPR